jgi:hypothetical protein
MYGLSEWVWVSQSVDISYDFKVNDRIFGANCLWDLVG